VDRAKKKDTRTLADLIVDAGGGLPVGIDYATYVGLVMNGHRMAMRRVYYDSLASSLANGIGDAPMEVVAAACNSKAEAEKLLFEINAARAAKAKGW
jgi:hypothetical protein